MNSKHALTTFPVTAYGEFTHHLWLCAACGLLARSDDSKVFDSPCPPWGNVTPPTNPVNHLVLTADGPRYVREVVEAYNRLFTYAGECRSNPDGRHRMECKDCGAAP